MKKQILSFLAIALICCGSAYAGVTPNLDKGTKQANLYGSYDSNSALDYQLTLAGGFGYFFWDNIEIGALVGWQSNDLSDKVELGLIGTYNFNFDSPWVPFLKVGILYAGLEIDDDIYDVDDEADANGAVGRLGLGIKYFFRDSVAMSLGVNYDKASENLYFDSDGSRDDYNVTALIGIEFYFD